MKISQFKTLKSNSKSNTKFDSSKMSGKPSTYKQCATVAGFVLDSFVKLAFDEDPRVDESESIVKSFNWKVRGRITRVLLDDAKFDSDACQAYFQNKDKAITKKHAVKVCKAFKDHNKEADRIDEFLKAVPTKV